MCTRLFGEPLLLHTLRGLERVEGVNHVVIALPPHQDPALSPDLSEILSAVDGARIQTCTGSADWMRSVRSADASGGVVEHDVLLVQDPTRPWTSIETIRTIVDTIRAGAPAAVPVVPITDTVKEVDSQNRIVTTRDRTRFRTLQAPWGFRAGVLDQVPSGGRLAQLGSAIQTITGDRYGMRVRTTFDLTVLEALVTSEETP